jgi:hypothetical protein
MTFSTVLRSPRQTVLGPPPPFAIISAIRVNGAHAESNMGELEQLLA